MSDLRRSSIAQRVKRNVRRARRGSEVLEAAMVFPILLALAFGTVEFGYYFYVEHNLESAAREGARAGIVPGASNEDIVSAVNEVMHQSGYAASDYDPPEITPDDEYLKVEVRVRWEQVSQGLRPMRMIRPPNDLVIGTATMRFER